MTNETEKKVLSIRKLNAAKPLGGIMENTNMSCPNCHKNKWENVDQFRIKPAGMGVCTTCGFISYPSKWQTEEEIKKHYRSNYRNPPNHLNYHAGERKNHFHHKFLEDLFKKWRDQGLENPKVCEVGAAYGMTLNFIKSQFPKAEICGTELTTSMRRNAYHEFGITLSEDIDETKKYDLIISYKVLEHQLDPDKALEKYTSLLTEGGLLYISVPTWFNSLYNFGQSGFDLEYYFDPNHINVWTREMFENILMRSGFEVIKNDQVIYSSTYLCKPNPELKKTPVIAIKSDEVKVALEKIKKAFIFFNDNKFDDALAQWPDYPQAHISRAEMTRKQLTEQGWDWFEDNIIEPAFAACPESADVLIMATDFAMRAGQFEQAVKYAEQALVMKPENPVSLNHLANIMRELALKSTGAKEKLHYFTQAKEVAKHLRRVSSQHFGPATDLVYFYNSKIPFKGENAHLKKVVEPPVEELENTSDLSL